VTIRVGVFGAGGRMGSTVCQAVAADPDVELVAAVDPHYSGLDLRTVIGVDTDLKFSRDGAAMAAADVDVAVDFTERSACCDTLGVLAAEGIHAVVGTTFAIGAVLMMHFAALAAPYFESAEIIELHHEHKVDAPSGTAMLTLQRMAEASGEWTADPTTTEVVVGARGGDGPSGIRVHSLRLKGLVAHQEVLLGTTGQTLSIRHDSIDRTSFMPGVLLAVKQVADRPGVTVGLDALLGL
jgi:4-hydroxy-tetrahydrodipicolinate reductase